MLAKFYAKWMAAGDVGRLRSTSECGVASAAIEGGLVNGDGKFRIESD